VKSGKKGERQRAVCLEKKGVREGNVRAKEKSGRDNIKQQRVDNKGGLGSSSGKGEEKRKCAPVLLQKKLRGVSADCQVRGKEN